jgi:hypothetical protein
VRSHVGRTSSKARRYASLAWGLAAFIAVFRREQTPACAVVSLHVEVGVILTAKAPNRRRSLRPFGGRDDAGPRSRNTGERKWTRPHCSSSSSWCCCSAAADSSTDAGFESDGRFARRDCSSPYARTPLPRAVADLGGIGDRTRRESTIDISLHGPFAGHTVVRHAKSRHPRGRGPRTPVAPTQIDARASLTLGPLKTHSPTNGRALWMTRRRH